MHDCKTNLTRIFQGHDLALKVIKGPGLAAMESLDKYVTSAQVWTESVQWFKRHNLFETSTKTET